MNDIVANIDADLKELFMESKFDEMYERMDKEKPEVVKEIADFNWGVVKKYFDTENFALLFQHLKFVAYTSFLVEYTYKNNLIGDDIFQLKMSIFQDIHEMIRQQKN